MKAYRIKGEFKDIRSMQDFTMEVAAEDQEQAKEKILCVLGSKHKQKRENIKISSVEEIDAKDVTNHTVQYQVGA